MPNTKIAAEIPVVISRADFDTSSQVQAIITEVGHLACVSENRGYRSRLCQRLYNSSFTVFNLYIPTRMIASQDESSKSPNGTPTPNLTSISGLFPGLAFPSIVSGLG